MLNLRFFFYRLLNSFLNTIFIVFIWFSINDSSIGSFQNFCINFQFFILTVHIIRILCRFLLLILYIVYLFVKALSWYMSTYTISLIAYICTIYSSLNFILKLIIYTTTCSSIRNTNISKASRNNSYRCILFSCNI